MDDKSNNPTQCKSVADIGISKPKVMIVDDESSIRAFVTRALNNLYEVISAANGEEALQKAGSINIDVVVSDINMPKLNGLELLKALKEIDPKIEVVMVTGYGTLENAVECMKAGAYDYISKPYNISELSRLVSRALDKRRLNREVDELKEINRFKSEFLANMSHELRTPMNAILGYTSLHLDRLYGDISAKQEESLKRVELAGKNLLNLINSILDLSKLSAGRMPVYTETFSLKDILDEVSGLLEGLSKAKNLVLDIKFPEKMIVRCDKTKLKQILINLISNGIKFTTSGGIYLSVEENESENNFSIKIRDTGKGISDSDKELLFQEFRQLDASPTREYGGTGLGLVISRKFARLMGGDISVDSVAGAGSTFVVTLPLKETPGLSVLENNFQPVHSDTREKVLLAIDDDPEVLTLLRDSLQGSGYTFAGALNAEEGLALARELKPFAITLDIMMPHKDGWSVLQMLKNELELNTIPVIILSVMDNKTLGYSLGVTDYILKPFERSELLKKLRSLDSSCGRDDMHKKNQRRVLVADPDETISQFLKDALTAEGYNVSAVADGIDALAIINEFPPDILFLDLMLPKIGGYEIIEALEKNPRLKDMSVFILTSNHLTSRESDYLEERTAAVMHKRSQNLSEILKSVKTRLKALEQNNAG